MIQLKELYYKFAVPLIIFSLAIALVGGTIIYINNTISIGYYGLIWLVVIITFLFYLGEKINKTNVCDSETTGTLTTPIISKAGERILDILFVAGYIYILYLLQFFAVRPIEYFITVSVMVGIIALSILMTPENRNPLKHILKILTISFLSVFSIFKIYVWIGYDTWTHAALNELIVQKGTILSVLGKEASYPFQHLMVALADILCGVDIRIASLLAVTIPLILVSSLAVYFIVSKVCNSRCALLAMLMFVFFAPVISWAQFAQTTSYGFLVFSLLMMVYFGWKYSEKTNNKRYFYLLLFIVLVVIMTHTFSSFIILGIVIALYLGSVISENKVFTDELVIFFLYLIILLIYWIFMSWGGSSTILEGVSSVAMDSFSFSERVLPDIAKYININPPSAIDSLLNLTFFYIIGIATTLFCIIVARSIMLEKSSIWSILMLSVISTGAYLGSMFIIPEMAERFGPYCAFISAIVIGYIIFYNISKVSKKKTVYLFISAIVLVVIIIAFLNVGATSINTDNPLWLTNTTQRVGATVAECTGTETLLQYLPGLTENTYDHLYSPVYGYYAYVQAYTTSQVVPQVQYHKPSYINWGELAESGKEYLLFRDIVLTRPTMQLIKYGDMFGQRTSQLIQLDQSYADRLNRDYKHVYSNGAIELYPLK